MPLNAPQTKKLTCGKNLQFLVLETAEPLCVIWSIRITIASHSYRFFAVLSILYRSVPYMPNLLFVCLPPPTVRIVALRNGVLFLRGGAEDGHRTNGIGPGTYDGKNVVSGGKCGLIVIGPEFFFCFFAYCFTAWNAKSTVAALRVNENRSADLASRCCCSS